MKFDIGGDCMHDIFFLRCMHCPMENNRRWECSMNSREEGIRVQKTYSSGIWCLRLIMKEEDWVSKMGYMKSKCIFKAMRVEHTILNDYVCMWCVKKDEAEDNDEQSQATTDNFLTRRKDGNEEAMLMMTIKEDGRWWRWTKKDLNLNENEKSESKTWIQRADGQRMIYGRPNKRQAARNIHSISLPSAPSTKSISSERRKLPYTKYKFSIR